MTNEQAIEALKEQKRGYEGVLRLKLDDPIRNIYEKILESFNLAIQALEKEIPKKVIRDSTSSPAICPVCFRDVLDDVCLGCYQVLDWSDKND